MDERDIRELRAKDVEGATQFHAFAGIGAWSHALRLARWPESVPVWTGSCPCQPFSVSGRRKGVEDERHLWPEWLRLIRECRPPVVFGEQVASPDGRVWLDTVSTDLEALGYAVGSADLCAAGVGAPHIRQRLWFVAISDRERRQRIDALFGKLGDADVGRFRGYARDGDPAQDQGGDGTNSDDARSSSAVRKLGNANRSRLERWQSQPRDDGQELTSSQRASRSTFWTDAEWILCSDNKTRPVEPGTFPLAHGTPHRVGQLRAYGNAIVPQVAATFIRAFMETTTK